MMSRRFIHQLRSCRRFLSSQNFNRPKDANEMPRSGGIASLFRLPVQESQPEGLDVCFVGIPMDSGANYRSGARLAPRAIRNESVLIRYMNVTGAVPFDSLQVADIGDVPIVPYNLQRSHEAILSYFRRIMKANCIPLTMGGDHSLSYPILKAIKEKHGPVGLVQIDAHTDLADTMSGEKFANGTTFRRVVEEGFVDPKHMIQIGLRGTLAVEEIETQFEWAQEKGIKQVFASQCWHKSLTPLMEQIRNDFKDIPTYFTFDIDGLEATNCPGAGTSEVGGLTPIQAIEVIRGLRGLNIVGADLAEVNPQCDPSRVTALMAANIMFELLCVLPGVKYRDISHIMTAEV